ncbi:MAG: transcriptional regulator [Flavobacteriales bacterium]|nr:transcriptional regulator [Flavobacteriales bacterium]
MSFAPLDASSTTSWRLAVVSLLVGVESAEFNFILEKTGATRGNLSVQLTKLKDEGFITITKGYRDNYPLTTCKLAPKGVKAFEQYVKAIQDYLKP